MDTSIPDPELACTLNEPENLRRRHTLARQLLSGAQEIRELSDGYALRFPGEQAWYMALVDFIAYERVCCSFLTLELKCEPHSGPIWLSISGPEGAKELLRREAASA